MDGVLLDSEPLYKKVQSHYFAELGFSVSDNEYDEFIGLGLEKMWQLIKSRRKIDLPLDKLIKVNNQKIKAYFQEIEALPPQPHLIEFLHYCQERSLKTAVASSTAKDIILIILKKLKILTYFNEIISGEEVQESKPAPDIFLEAAARMFTQPDHCLVIEDSENGVKAAKVAGMFCVGFDNPNSGKMNLEKADLIANNFEQIREILSI